MKKLTNISIISGPNKEVDLERGGAALEYYLENGLTVPIKILGAGPDLEKAKEIYNLFIDKKISGEEYDLLLKGLDHHLDLYNYVKSFGVKFEAVTEPTTLVQDIVYGFRNEKKVLSGIVTEPWHYKKFNFAQEVLKFKGKIPKDIDFFSIPSKDLVNYTAPRKILSYAKTGIELLTI